MISSGYSLIKRSRRAVLFSCASIALGFGAQYTLDNEVIALGLIGYVVAVVLFVWCFRPYLAGSLATVEVMESQEASSDGRSAGWGKLKYLRYHWRELTLAEIFSGEIPILSEQEESVQADTTVGTAGEGPIPAEQVLTKPPATLEKHTPQKVVPPTQAAAPPIMTRTPSGEVFIFDRQQGLVYHYDAHNTLVAQWTIPQPSEIDVADLEVSDDSVSLLDAAGRQMVVIRLDPDEKK